jgi:hypothetical protein
VSPIRAGNTVALFELRRKAHNKCGIDFFPAFCVGLREMHLIVEIVFDRDEPKKKAAMDCLRDIINDAARQGHGE